MRRKEFLAAAAGAAATLAAAGAALAQTAPPPPPTRGEIGSARNLRTIRVRLEHLIDELQRDQHDYDGWRVKAIAQMQQARTDLIQALQWDATHPH